MPIILPAQEAEVGGLWSEAGLGKSRRPYLKNKLKAKERTRGIAQVLEHLPSKLEILSSIPSINNNNK
jgi:hypothetical protein